MRTSSEPWLSHAPVSAQLTAFTAALRSAQPIPSVSLHPLPFRQSPVSLPRSMDGPLSLAACVHSPVGTAGDLLQGLCPSRDYWSVRSSRW